MPAGFGQESAGTKNIKTMGELEEYAKANSPYLMLKPGESAVGIYLGYKMVPSFRDPTKENPRYEVEINGEKKLFTSSASRIALFFAEAKDGDFIKITKIKQGESVHYEVQKANGDTPVWNKGNPEISDEDMEEIDKSAKKKTQTLLAGRLGFAWWERPKESGAIPSGGPKKTL